LGLDSRGESAVARGTGTFKKKEAVWPQKSLSGCRPFARLPVAYFKYRAQEFARECGLAAGGAAPGLHRRTLESHRGRLS